MLCSTRGILIAVFDHFIDTDMLLASHHSDIILASVVNRYRILDPIFGYENTHTIIDNQRNQSGSAQCAGCLDTVRRVVR